jgi:hypothetical protein
MPRLAADGAEEIQVSAGARSSHAPLSLPSKTSTINLRSCRRVSLASRD